jgi:hypothetical protein
MTDKVDKTIYNIYSFRGVYQTSFPTYVEGFDWMSKQEYPDRYYGEWDNASKQEEAARAEAEAHQADLT